jgi:hypothetical protein
MYHEHPEAKAQTVDELLAAAARMPGVADLLALYQQQARIVEAANMYIIRPSPQSVLSAGTGTPSLAG